MNPIPFLFVSILVAVLATTADAFNSIGSNCYAISPAYFQKCMAEKAGRKIRPAFQCRGLPPQFYAKCLEALAVNKGEPASLVLGGTCASTGPAYKECLAKLEARVEEATRDSPPKPGANCGGVGPDDREECLRKLLKSLGS